MVKSRKENEDTYDDDRDGAVGMLGRKKKSVFVMRESQARNLPQMLHTFVISNRFPHKHEILE